MNHFSGLLSSSSNGISELYYAATFTFGGVVVVLGISGWLGALLSNSIRRIRSLSYLKLTRGDDISLKEFQTHNTRSWLKGLASVAGAVILNVLSGWLALKIGLTP